MLKGYVGRTGKGAAPSVVSRTVAVLVLDRSSIWLSYKWQLLRLPPHPIHILTSLSYLTCLTVQSVRVWNCASKSRQRSGSPHLCRSGTISTHISLRCLPLRKWSGICVFTSAFRISPAPFAHIHDMMSWTRRVQAPMTTNVTVLWSSSEITEYLTSLCREVRRWLGRVCRG